ncbi:hypothetical protein INR49_013393 [Caranx melampygus]|nr:hypothetical protein INR49_013393 [Caranx melampygus]
MQASNPANFGPKKYCLRECICEVDGQVPCPGTTPLPKEMTGKYQAKMAASQDVPWQIVFSMYMELHLVKSAAEFGIKDVGPNVIDLLEQQLFLYHVQIWQSFIIIVSVKGIGRDSWRIPRGLHERVTRVSVVIILLKRVSLYSLSLLVFLRIFVKGIICCSVFLSLEAPCRADVQRSSPGDRRQGGAHTRAPLLSLLPFPGLQATELPLLQVLLRSQLLGESDGQAGLLLVVFILELTQVLLQHGHLVCSLGLPGLTEE